MKLLVSAVLVLTCLAACGAEPPSKDDLAFELSESSELSDAAAECVADELLDSDLNDNLLAAIAEDEEVRGDEREEIEDAVDDALADCVPTQDELAASLVENGSLDQDQADCAAEALLDGDLSYAQLDAVATDDESDLSEEEKSAVVDVLSAALTDCVTG